MHTFVGRSSFSFFRKHFNGDYSLARSYWEHLLLLQLAFLGASAVLLGWLAEHFPARHSSRMIIFLTLFGYVVWGWLVGGTWASASKHVARGGSPDWAGLVKFLILVGGVRLLLATPDNVHTVSGHWDVARGAQLGPRVLLHVSGDGKAIRLAGGINDGTAEALASKLDEFPAATTVVLASSGGWTREGKLIARVIGARGLGTRVDTECSSACTIAFLAGKVRTAQPGARLGFHAFSAVGGETLGGPVKQTYAEAGLGPAFIAKILATPPAQMWYPEQDELFAQGVLTEPPASDHQLSKL